MVDEKTFIERIKFLRQKTAKVREDEQGALLQTMEDMDDALGHMISFTCMNSLEFPISVEELTVSANAEQPPEFGAHVVALRDEGRASRVYAEITSNEAEEFVSLTLHNGKALSTFRWVLETNVRAFDGHDATSKTYFEDAEAALKALKTRVLTSAVRSITRGHLVIENPLPDTDAEAALAIKDVIDNACDFSQNLHKLMKTQREDRYRASMALSGIWSSLRPELSFLRDIDFGFDGEGYRSIKAENTPAGIRIVLDHGEGYVSTINAEALDLDPQTVAFSVSDVEGRFLKTTQVSLSDVKNLSEQIKYHILEEIEGAEAAWLPAVENEQENSFKPSMGM